MSSGLRYDGSNVVVTVVGGQIQDPENDNVDVEVRLENGKRYGATFFTIENIRHLFDKNKSTGECQNGLYFWCPDMIIVERLTLEVIQTTVAALMESKEADEEFEKAFVRLDGDEE